ncbi:phospho-sugar mutase [Facklamia sp. DSM 111018]|uniref:Phosphoglucomutase n=1 Tax=Facklamia lactis TaxID=2749967 RepID=A0ABS0LQU4_9LACT|nr:phospho-sugar mutase [Facklamia lactis]MBG9980694.1 phospho-sugar mutase [Facklamia lactis]MBG9986508.1 phospho-sugar mutase [Facklamia lactis]
MEWRETYDHWKNAESLDQTVQTALEDQTEEELQDAFGGFLSFGTAGMRGVIGAGPNRMNVYTVRQATEGLAKLIEEAGSEAMERGVAIAYDSRHFSPEFAMEAALVLGNHGIKVYVFESLRPTPTLSFTVRYLNAYAGIMITASHNPAEYNGYKVYGEDGGQMPPEEADKLTDFVRQIDDPLAVEIGNKTELLGSGQIEIIGERVDQAYLEKMKTVTIDSELIHSMAEEVKIVFTPLHGTGMYLGMKALEQAGFTHVHVVEEQAKADGSFPTVTSPNPESPAAFDLAEQLGRSIEADILLATDPDADRLGAMIRTAEGSYQLLTGNQIACLMLDYILQALQSNGQLPSNGAVVKSMVSTNLADRICDAYDVEMIEVLTGFKFIAEKIKQYEESESHEFLMGFEESFGYLIKPFARDKDAIQALVVLAELTAYHKKHGHTLADALDQIYQKYGYFFEKTISVSYPGLEGQAQMKTIMDKIRQQEIKEFAGVKVIERIDYLSGKLIYEDGRETQLTYPKSDALKFVLEDQSWMALRPSGTEPKIKLYIGASGNNQQEVEEKAAKYEEVLKSLTK